MPSAENIFFIHSADGKPVIRVYVMCCVGQKNYTNTACIGLTLTVDFTRIVFITVTAHVNRHQCTRNIRCKHYSRTANLHL